MTPIVFVVVAGVLLVVGGLIGNSLARRALRFEIRRLAEGRRVVGEQRRAVQTARVAALEREAVPWG